MPAVPPDQILQLYIDDSGSRRPDKDASDARRDRMNAFGLGGILVRATDVPGILDFHGEFCRRWRIDYPLHSTRIRTRRGPFAWLGTDSEDEERFLRELEIMVLALPVVCLACAVHRPGYMDRYFEQYEGKPWMMCRTAFAILIERAAKYADRHGYQLEVYFEQAGKHEDRNIKAYMRELKTVGMPFTGPAAHKYASLQAGDFTRIILGEPRERTKRTALCQIADLVLYPMVKGRYEPTYRPYSELMRHGKLIDSTLTDEEIEHLGIKYSCFDGITSVRKD